MRNLTLIPALLLAAGCSMMPEYQRPDAPVAVAWPTPQAAASPALPWQQFVQDARLQVLIQAALEHNRDLRVAVARVEEARAQYGIVFADRLPNLALGASENASRTPGAFTLTGASSLSRRYDVGVNLLSFELDFWGRVRSLSTAARHSYLASEEARQAFTLSLIADVSNAYFSQLELDERVRYTEETLKARLAWRELTEKRFRTGVISQLDTLQAEGQVQTLRAELSNLRRQQAAARHTLDLLVGTQPEPLPAATTLSQIQLPVLQADVPSTVLLQRPDVRAAEHRLQAANAHIGAARAAFFPRISLTGSAGSASRDMNRLFDSGTQAWSFVPQLLLPLFDAGRNSNNLDLAETRKVIAVAEYEKSIQLAFREVADALVANTELAQQLDAQQANASAQQQRLRLVQKRYEVGIASYLEVLDAQRDAYNAEQVAVAVRRQLLGARINLFKALGQEASLGQAPAERSDS